MSWRHNAKHDLIALVVGVLQQAVILHMAHPIALHIAHHHPAHHGVAAVAGTLGTLAVIVAGHLLLAQDHQDNKGSRTTV